MPEVKTYTEERYRARLEKFLSQEDVQNNKELFKKFFTQQERRLKRRRSAISLDRGNIKTLVGYIHKFSNVNKWFKGKDWRKLTKEDIQKVYDNLEDGKILNSRGKPFEDRRSYYQKVLLSKPFQIAGVVEYAKEVFEDYAPPKAEQVKFVTFEKFEELADAVIKPEHKALIWLAFDIGENINTLLELRVSDVQETINEETKEPEFMVYLYDNLKRTRTKRTEITNYSQTYRYLKKLIDNLDKQDNLFNITYRAALKFLNGAGRRSGVTCEPIPESVTWKDLRSSMACDLLKKGWDINEVKARLGHSPSSPMIDKYVNYLAIGRNKPKIKVQQFKLEEMQKELEESKQREKLQAQRQKELDERLLRIEKAVILKNQLS